MGVRTDELYTITFTVLSSIIIFQVNDTLNELESIDLTDPDLHKAATKIQASFRGHKVRQDVPAATETSK